MILRTSGFVGCSASGATGMEVVTGFFTDRYNLPALATLFKYASSTMGGFLSIRYVGRHCQFDRLYKR